jgi:hypothetical protein
MSVKESILKFNKRLFAHRRELAVRLRQQRQREEQEVAALELLIDDVVYHSGIKPTKANLPLLMGYITQAVRDARGQSSDDDDGMSMDGF